MFNSHALQTFTELLMYIIAGFILAFFATRLFKPCITIVGTIFFGVIGYQIATPILSPILGEAMYTLPINLPVVLGLVFAGLGCFLSFRIYRFAVLLFGGAMGYFLGTYIASIIMIEEPISTLLSIASAVIVGIIALFAFKFVFILSTSVTGSLLACAPSFFMISKTDTTAITIEGEIIILAIVLVITVISMIYQYMHSENM